jgi:hypothetical protein
MKHEQIPILESKKLFAGYPIGTKVDLSRLSRESRRRLWTVAIFARGRPTKAFNDLSKRERMFAGHLQNELVEEFHAAMDRSRAMIQEMEGALTKDPTAAQKEISAYPMPGKGTATLQDFLTLIVKAKTVADSTKRMRDFLDWFNKEVDPLFETTLEDIKNRDKRGGFFNIFLWTLFKERYQIWWSGQKSAQAKKNRSKRTHYPRAHPS